MELVLITKSDLEKIIDDKLRELLKSLPKPDPQPPHQNNDPEFYSIKELSRRLSLSTSAIKSYIKKEVIHSVKFGKRVLIPAEEYARIRSIMAKNGGIYGNISVGNIKLVK